MTIEEAHELLDKMYQLANKRKFVKNKVKWALLNTLDNCDYKLDDGRIMYALKNMRTGNYVYDTDRHFSPPHQRTSSNSMITYYSVYEARDALRSRECCNDYDVVCVIVHEL